MENELGEIFTREDDLSGFMRIGILKGDKTLQECRNARKSVDATERTGMTVIVVTIG
jgi:fructose/tagatose bisphosphate aldolase